MTHQHKKTRDEKLFDSQLEQALAAMQTDTWQVFRILSEFVDGFEKLAGLEQAVTIFGSARTKPNHPQYQQAVAAAKLLGESGFNIISGGGPGIMQAANKGANEAGVTSVGLNIELPFEQNNNPYITLPVDFNYFFIRKTMFVKYCQAFVIFPGGFGTMDELFESLTLIQTGKIHNFPVVLFGADYWGGLIDWLRHTMLAEGKISPEDMELMIVTDSIEEMRDHIVDCLGGNVDRHRQENAAIEVTRRVFGGNGDI